MTSYRPPCTSDELYRILPTSRDGAMTAPEIANERGYYPSTVPESIRRLERQLADPTRADRVGTIRWEPPEEGSELQRVWLDKGDGTTCPPADDPQPDEPGDEEEEIEVTERSPPDPGTGPKSSSGTSPQAEDGDVQEPEPEDPNPSPASPQPHQKTARSPSSPPCWQEVAAAIPTSEEDAITFEEIAAKFPGTGLSAEGVCHRIKHARKAGIPIRSKTIAGSRFAYHWLPGDAPEIPPPGRASRRSPSRAQAPPQTVESQIKEWIRGGLIVSADVRMMEDGIETRLKYPVEAA